MIGLLFGSLSAKLIVLAVVLAIIGGIGLKVYNAGYNSADQMWKAAVAKEQQRQQQVQEDARRAAEEEIRKLLEKQDYLNAELAILEAAAAAAPNAGNCGLDADSVQRVDGVR